MGKYEPPYTISNKMLELVSSISEKVGKISSHRELEARPHLRKNNRIRSIHSSLKIEANSLSLAEVRDVINGHLVLGDQKEIQEVKNAYAAYEKISEINPKSMSDLKKIHGIMTYRTVGESGVFRKGEEGVFSGDRCIFVAPPPNMVNELMKDLFSWVKNSEGTIHPLIMSAVFHYEFVFIHPFADGNGRIGRLWHTLLLSRWNPLFAWLPVESIVHDHQQEYYEAINTSNAQGEGTAFIEFMLSVIEEALLSVIPENFEKSMMPTSGKENRWNILEKYLKKEKIIHNSDVQQLLEVSSATANRILVSFVKEGKLERVRDGRYWAYQKL